MRVRESKPKLARVREAPAGEHEAAAELRLEMSAFERVPALGPDQVFQMPPPDQLLRTPADQAPNVWLGVSEGPNATAGSGSQESVLERSRSPKPSASRASAARTVVRG